MLITFLLFCYIDTYLSVESEEEEEEEEEDDDDEHNSLS